MPIIRQILFNINDDIGNKMNTANVAALNNGVKTILSPLAK